MPDAPLNARPDDGGPAGSAVTVRPGQSHFFAQFDDAEALGAVDAPDETTAPTSLWKDAWLQMRRRPLFWVSAFLIVLVVLVAAFPQLFSQTNPRFCELGRSLGEPGAGHWFGFDRQGCDIYARVVFGARASVTVGVLTTLGVSVLGVVVGSIAGYYGKWFDVILSRVTDIFFAIPLLLAAILVASVFSQNRTTLLVAAVLAVFGWPQIARITRGAVLSVKNNEFVTAAQALGISKPGILLRHVIPNAIAPVIATATVALGTFIVVEATLSFLGVGLPPSVVSWGGDIARAQQVIRNAPQLLFYPGAALGLTVLSFIMMGDVVRDALDPKARTR
ncbi:ABC transporter permease [Xylanimonas ulmi]|uniref:Oligopeptide transport system permease protein n=1 Tax=Xylanimonas ulmi TaxID=228973 RepID=A0A4Q7M6R6_9MICO|nr:ABC transporter permease [Xylanibacterium ulmi]RZS61779.1 oligopeptide transport system permease protein [Xylanibacterium ulmi]